MPQVVAQQWAAHPTFGTEFQQLLADHIAEFGEAPPEKAGSSGQANSCPEPSPKKRRTTAPLKSELVDNLPAVKLAQAAVVGLKKELLGKIMIRVSTDRSWLLVNVSQNVAALPAGTGWFWARYIQTCASPCRGENWPCRCGKTHPLRHEERQHPCAPQWQVAHAGRDCECSAGQPCCH